MLILVLLLLPNCMWGQNDPDPGLGRPPAAMPEQYRVDARAYYDELSTEPYQRHRKRDLERFAELTAYGKKHLMTTGMVYFDPPMVESYLDSMATKLLPNGGVKVYLARDPTYNAFAIHDGSLFIHVGILAEMHNEAALASIMGHEIAHFINDDNRVSFFNKLALHTRKNRHLNIELRIDKAHDDRLMEHIADSIGYSLARKAGYDIHHAIFNHLLFMKDEPDSSEIATPGAEAGSVALDILLADHPVTRDRIAFLENWLAVDPSMAGGADRLFSRHTFNTIRDLARAETVKLLLEEHEYLECMERAFRFHLLDRDEPLYMYYLAESLRRYLTLNSRAADKGFLVEGREKYFKENEGILSNIAMILPDTALLNELDLAEYVEGMIPFHTNRQAFEYFLQRAERAGSVEVLLTKAIYQMEDEVLRDRTLEQYITMGGAARTFATAFRSGTLERELQNCTTELVLLDDLDYIEDHFYGYRLRHGLAERKGGDHIRTAWSAISKAAPAKTVVRMSELKEEEHAKYMLYRQVIKDLEFGRNNWHGSVFLNTFDVDKAVGNDRSNSAEKQRRRSNGFRFYFRDPSLYEFLVNGGYRSVEYLKVQSFDDRTKIINNAIAGVFFLYPGFWVNRIEKGSNRYAFKIDHTKFNTGDDDVRSRGRVVPYRMTRPNLNSVVYESLMTIGR